MRICCVILVSPFCFFLYYISMHILIQWPHSSPFSISQVRFVGLRFTVGPRAQAQPSLRRWFWTGQLGRGWFALRNLWTVRTSESTALLSKPMTAERALMGPTAKNHTSKKHCNSHWALLKLLKLLNAFHFQMKRECPCQLCRIMGCTSSFRLVSVSINLLHC